MPALSFVWSYERAPNKVGRPLYIFVSPAACWSVYRSCRSLKLLVHQYSAPCHARHGYFGWSLELLPEMGRRDMSQFQNRSGLLLPQLHSAETLVPASVSSS